MGYSYSTYELMFFLICYSFLGWCMEVCYMAVRTRRFCNRGFLNLPLSLSYGFAMDLLILVLPTLQGAYILQWIVLLVVASSSAQLADEVSVRVTGQRLWEQERRSVYFGRLTGLVYALLMGSIALLMVLLVHPLLYLLCHMLPALLLRGMVWVVCLLMAVDFTVVFYTMRKRPFPEGMQTISNELLEQKKSFGSWLSAHIWRRLEKAYPKLRAIGQEEVREGKDCVFAEGFCLDKLWGIFFISALGGDLIETFYVRATAGIWMSRSSVLYGPFSIVWGVGAVLLTVLLRRFSDKEDRYVFLGGFFLGGTYEYLCSVFTEVFLGTTFWDYSDMAFNIGGRTNLLFCIFWGILALVWVKICYPPLSRMIEKIPPVTGKVVTWVLVGLMACDVVISAMAMIRYVERAEGVEAENKVGEFLDMEYPDELIEWRWENLRIE